MGFGPNHRDFMIREAAYFRSEKRSFSPGNELEDWLVAEQDIEASLGEHDKPAAVNETRGGTTPGGNGHVGEGSRAGLPPSSQHPGAAEQGLEPAGYAPDVAEAAASKTTALARPVKRQNSRQTTQGRQVTESQQGPAAAAALQRELKDPPKKRRDRATARPDRPFKRKDG